MNTPTDPQKDVATAPAGIPPDPGPPLQALVLYEDALAGRQAMQVLRRLDPQAALNPIFWRFDLLENPEWRAFALQDAAAAGLIIVATGDPDHLPDCVNAWSAECIVRRQGRPLAMVTFFGRLDAGWSIWIQDGSQVRTKRQFPLARRVFPPNLAATGSAA